MPSPRRAEMRIAIIGSGFAGIGMAIRLKRLGYRSFTIYEAAGDLGGTWRDNTYPGAACDVPSHLYSFSFEANPSWSRAFSHQDEILAYLKHCACKYGVDFKADRDLKARVLRLERALLPPRPNPRGRPANSTGTRAITLYRKFRRESPDESPRKLWARVYPKVIDGWANMSI